MDRIDQVRQALVARSKTATLDELRNQGKRSVKIVNPQQIAAMLAEAVETAVQSSGLFSPE